jgi:hypothetical protein
VLEDAFFENHALLSARKTRVLDGVPFDQGAPQGVEKLSAACERTVLGAVGKAAQLREHDSQIIDVDPLVLADAADEFDRGGGTFAAPGEKIPILHQCLDEHEGVLGPNPDQEDIHEQKDHALMGAGQEWQQCVVLVRAGNVRGNRGIGPAATCKEKVTQGKPHRVVASDSAGGVPAFIEAVRTQKALVEVANGRLTHVFDDDPLELWSGHLTQVEERQAIPREIKHLGHR